MEGVINMPYINSTLTIKLSEDQKENLKSQLGEIISAIPGKSEEWLMVTFNDDEVIYFRGKKMEKAAYVEVKIAGTTEREYKNKVTSLLCNLFEEKISIPKDSIFITFSEIADWGWNGELF
jgi:phenylpyruvate tautomerase PptA (4-oxalocrotonate tautomerase family)